MEPAPEVVAPVAEKEDYFVYLPLVIKNWDGTVTPLPANLALSLSDGDVSVQAGDTLV